MRAEWLRYQIWLVGSHIVTENKLTLYLRTPTCQNHRTIQGWAKERSPRLRDSRLLAPSGRGAPRVHAT